MLLLLNSVSNVSKDISFSSGFFIGLIFGCLLCIYLYIVYLVDKKYKDKYNKEYKDNEDMKNINVAIKDIYDNE